MEQIKRFMVVAGNDDDLNEMKALLGGLQFDGVTLAKGGEEGLSLVEPKKIQFIILYWEMSGMTGAVFVQKLKSQAAFRDLPVLIMSEKIAKEDSRLTKELELRNILPKPIDSDATKARIKDMIEQEEKLDPVLRKLRQASGFLHDGKISEAMNMVKECTTNKDFFVPTNTLMGEIKVKETKFQDAEKILQEVLGQKATFSPAKQLLAKCFSKTGKHQEAIKLLTEMVDHSPLSMSCLLSLGAAYYDADEMEKAKEAYGKVKKMDESNDEANTGLGTIAFKEGDFEAAKEFFQHSTDTFEIIRNMNNVGIGLINSEKFDEGIESYNAAIKMIEGKENLHLLQYNLGLAYKKKGDFAKALEYLAESLFSDPSYDKAYNTFAKAVSDMKAKGEKPNSDLIAKVKAAREGKKAG